MSHVKQSTITKQIRDNTERAHTPVTRMLMTYRDAKDEPFAHVLKMGTPGADDKILRTLKWASHTGIEVTFRPV